MKRENHLLHCWSRIYIQNPILGHHAGQQPLLATIAQALVSIAVGSIALRKGLRLSHCDHCCALMRICYKTPWKWSCENVVFL